VKENLANKNEGEHEDVIIKYDNDLSEKREEKDKDKDDKKEDKESK
jgi:hypothetical protein